MVRGLFGGLVWGGLLAGVGLAALSVLTPLPEGPRSAQTGDNGAATPDMAGSGESTDPSSVVLSEAGSDADMPGSEAPPPIAEDSATTEAEGRPEDASETTAPGTVAEPDVQEAGDAGEALTPAPAPTTEGAELARAPQAGELTPPAPPVAETAGTDRTKASPQLAPNDVAVVDRPVEADAAPMAVEAESGPAIIAAPSAPIPEAPRPAAETVPDVDGAKGPGRLDSPDPDRQPEAEASTPLAPQPEVAPAESPIVIVEETPKEADAEDKVAEAPTPPADQPPSASAEERPAPRLAPEPGPEPAPEPDTDTAAVASEEPPRRTDAVPVRRPGAQTGDGDATAATPGLTSSVDGVTTGRLPRIAPTDAEGNVTPTGDSVDAGSTEPTGAEAPAYIQFARAFDNPAVKPVFAIVLRDTGGPDIDREALAALPFPVSFAIDPTLPDAENAALIYRSAGQEVLMLATGLPEGATASDIEVTFGVHDRTLEEAVAVLDPATGGVQGNRSLAQQVLEVVKAQGRGVLSWDRGLNAVSQIARREGMQNAVIFRNLDAEGEAGPVIRRYLDRAAFKAAQDGRVIVAGSTRPETVAAILEWTVEGRADTVALAPVTAAMTAQ